MNFFQHFIFKKICGRQYSGLFLKKAKMIDWIRSKLSSGKEHICHMTLQTYKYKRQPASSVHSVIANRALLVGTAQGFV